ncbi:Endonuclease/exonuclease/phosphatase [Xenorhabdus poinarii G6]|uniref:Endonuclease/exonuclease/phosphatase n=1 Tax=Xenorhabdus poinarii G6 TaxID=1354304 RepID=A0A068QZA8_9GAMM|nr:endonuclease/exonuclease/phosphatase family protein [Xenorhabdus poinarii]CDG20248.1 Endonuclease/exonuclease/phosphatase [Xenorhabdus poinarii G6]
MTRKYLANVSVVCLISASCIPYSSATDLVETQYLSTPNKIYHAGDKYPRIKVATYNIAGGLRNHTVNIALVSEAIMKLNPDIITLEEVDQGTARSHGLDQAKEIARKTGMYYSFGKSLDMEGGSYGNAILSKFPIEKTMVFKLPSGSEEPRSLMISKINVPGFDAAVYVYNSHFDWREDDTVRMAQARFINSIVFDDRDLDKVLPNLATGITILMGDFNSVKSDRVTKEIGKYWQLVDVIGTDTRTWPAGNPGLDLDHIFTGKGQKWIIEKLTIPNDGKEAFGIKWQTVSDHIPVMATMKLVEQ